MPQLTSARLAPGSTARLDAYADSALGCPPDRARAGGVHLLAVARRGLPAWHGYTLPVVGLSFAEGAVLASRPDLLDRLRLELGSDLRLPRLDLAALERLRRAVQRSVPSAFILAGDLRAADRATFRPSPTMERAEWIPRPDAAALHLRARFDGEVFGVRGPRGRVVAWAALKLKEPDVWEIAVATEPDYRGRGFGRDVVSAATRFALDRGRLPIYIHDRANLTSAFVSRALGYQRYADIVLAEY